MRLIVSTVASVDTLIDATDSMGHAIYLRIGRLGIDGRDKLVGR